MKNQYPGQSFWDSTRILCAAISVLIGATAMIAWHYKLSTFIQMGPHIAPIRFNTAFCLFFTGLSVIFITSPKTQLYAIVFSFLSILMAGISGMQYIIGIKFGIDSIFVDPYITTKTSHPGRMSPNACLSLTLLPISILSWQFIENGQKKLATCLPSAAIPLLLSVFALLGYAFDIESGYSWWSLSSMSPPAATGIFFLSLSILSLIPKLGDHHKNLSDKFIWRPAFIATLGIALTFLLSQNILMTVRKNAEEMASADLSHKIQIIKLEISEDIDAMLRMKDRLNSAKSMNLSDWERDAKNYIADNAAYKGFILIDDQFNQIQNIRPADSDLEWNKRHLSGISNFGNIKNREFILKKTEYSKDTEGVEFIFPISHKDVSGFLIVPYDVSYKINLTPDTIRKEKSYLTISDSVEGIVFSSRENIDFPWKIEKNEIIEISSLIWAAHQVVDASNYRSSTLAVIVLLSGIGLSIMLSYLVLQNHKISFFAQNIKLSKERYDFALGSAIVGVWNWEIEGDKTIWSGASWKILGALDNDYLTKNYQTIKHEIFGSLLKELQEKSLAMMIEDKDFMINFPVRTLDRRDIWVQVRGRAVQYKDNIPTHAAGTIIEITKQKIFETELIRSNQELEKFAYVASHDLKAPLRGIDNLAKWVQEDSGPLLPKESHDKLSLLRERIKRLETLLQDILEYSRAGRFVSDPVEIDIKSLVLQLSQSHMPSSFKLDVVGDLPFVISSQTPLEQVFGNLLSNAVKHHDRKEGKIEIEAREHPEFIEFIIRDDGPGIPTQYHERVFGMFQTLQSRDKVSGSGLGLAIIKKLVEWQNGRVWIVSEDGRRGTEIHFLWPKNAARY